MKASQFNIIVPHEQEKFIIFNTFSTGCVALQKPLYQKIFVEQDYNCPEARLLYENGFFVDDDTDEVQKVESLRSEIRKNNIQNIVILTTTECNARCYYCFEHGIEPVIMTRKTADALIEFCKKIYKDEKIAISWFGGEPLMNFDIIEYVTLKLLEAGYKLETHVTTNGSLLTPDMVAFFKKHYECGVSFQITIDAVGTEYGKIKRYVDIAESKAYERTMTNIKMLISQGISLIVRVNFAASEIEKAKDRYKTIISDLNGLDLSNTYVYLAPLTLPGDKEIISNFHGNIEHPLLQMVKTQIEAGFPLQKLRTDETESLLSAFDLTPSAIPCGMSLPSRVVVDSNGNLYKCHRLVGKKQYAVGDVFHGFSKDCAMLDFYYQEKVTDKECKKCSILPICQEGCKYMRIMFGDKQKCNRIKQVKEELVKLYYDASHK